MKELGGEGSVGEGRKCEIILMRTLFVLHTGEQAYEHLRRLEGPHCRTHIKMLLGRS